MKTIDCNALNAHDPTMCSPTISHRQLIYQDRYHRISRVVANFGDFTKEYFVNETGTRVGLLVIKDCKVLLVQQYRLLIDRLSWEIPGGCVDEGETPEAAAVRECLEETGVRCFNLQPLVFYYPGLDTANNPTHLFFCDSIAEAKEPHHVDMREVSHWEWVTLEQCIAMIFSREIQDSLTMLGVLAYKTRLALSVQE